MATLAQSQPHQRPIALCRYDSLGVLGNEGSDFGLGDDGVEEGRKCRESVDDGRGDAVKHSTLEVQDVERGQNVCHGHL